MNTVRTTDIRGYLATAGVDARHALWSAADAAFGALNRFFAIKPMPSTVPVRTDHTGIRHRPTGDST